MGEYLLGKMRNLFSTDEIGRGIASRVKITSEYHSNAGAPPFVGSVTIAVSEFCIAERVGNIEEKLSLVGYLEEGDVVIKLRHRFLGIPHYSYKVAKRGESI